MRSVACGPTMWTPSVSSVSASAMTLAKPSYSPPMIALAIAWNGTLPILTLRPRSVALRLGQADRGDLRPAVRRARLGGVVHLVDVGVAGDRVRGDEPLVRRRVGEPQAADDVADRVDVRLLRPHPAVDLDDAAVGLDLGRLEADVLDVGGAAGGDEHQLGAELGRLLALRADHQADARPRRRSPTPASKRALVMTVMPRLVKLRSTTLLTSASSSGTICGRYSSSGHLDAEVVVHAGELDADRARPDDDDVLRQRVDLEDVVAGDDALAVGRRGPGSDLTREPVAMMTSVAFRTRSPPRARRAVLAGLADADLARTVEPAAAGDPGHLVLVDEGLEPGPHPLDDRVAPGGHRRVVDRRPRRAGPGRSPWRGGRGRRRPPIRAAPWSGCSRGGGTCRRSCPRRRGRP